MSISGLLPESPMGLEELAALRPGQPSPHTRVAVVEAPLDCGAQTGPGHRAVQADEASRFNLFLVKEQGMTLQAAGTFAPVFYLLRCCRRSNNPLSTHCRSVSMWSSQSLFSKTA
jgi:hypothetical protein